MTGKIAVIDDVPAIANMYKYKLEDLGFTVETARNGKIGLEIIEALKPDLILVDLMMPEMSGDEMIAKLHTYEWAKDIIVIMLSNVGSVDMPPSIKKLKIDKFLIKAEFTPAEVAKVVTDLLSSKK